MREAIAWNYDSCGNPVFSCASEVLLQAADLLDCGTCGSVVGFWEEIGACSAVGKCRGIVIKCRSSTASIGTMGSYCAVLSLVQCLYPQN